MPVRVWKEVQEMSRRIALLLASVSGLPGAIWPEQLWEHKRSAIRPAVTAPADQGAWNEYGLEVAEEAQYGSWKGIGYRLKDTTSAFAVYQWLKPADAKASPLEKFAVQNSSRAFLLKGNFVLDFVGRVPTQQEVDILHVQLARLDQSALPSLPTFLPAANLIPGSERYVIGPATLEKFEPRISPSIAAFSMGAEAQLARYQTPKGEANLALFGYPTPHIARERVIEFQKIPGARTKRTGPLVAVTIAAPDADEAEKLLAKVDYQATITWNEKPPVPEPSAAALILGIFVNIGIIAGCAVLAGIGYAGVRIGWRKLRGRTEADEQMLTLDLGRPPQNEG
jgi:hypothetical protein